MKYFLIILLLFSYEANALNCKIERSDNITLYGECIKEKDVLIFISCAEFSCRVNPSYTRALDKKEKGCSLNKSDAELIKSIRDEHKVDSLDKVEYCLHGR